MSETTYTDLSEEGYIDISDDLILAETYGTGEMTMDLPCDPVTPAIGEPASRMTTYQSLGLKRLLTACHQAAGVLEHAHAERLLRALPPTRLLDGKTTEDLILAQILQTELQLIDLVAAIEIRMKA